MKSVLLAALVMALAVGTVSAGEIYRLNLDDAASLGTTIETDSVVKAEGEGSVKIVTRYPTTVGHAPRKTVFPDIITPWLTSAQDQIGPKRS